MAKYQIWDGISDVYTPGGKMYTAEEWKEKYEWLKVPGVKAVMSGGVINGAFIAEFGQFKENYKNAGVVFTDDMTDEEILSAIEEFEDSQGGQGDPEPNYVDKDVIDFENTQNVYISNADHTKGPFPMVDIYRYEENGMYSKFYDYSIMFGDHGEIKIDFSKVQTGKVVIQ